jgi:hypothetical protein
MQSRPILIDVDARKRCSLGRLTDGHDRYLGTVDENGVITLTPAEIVPMVRRHRPGPAPKGGQR